MELEDFGGYLAKVDNRFAHELFGYYYDTSLVVFGCIDDLYDVARRVYDHSALFDLMGLKVYI